MKKPLLLLIIYLIVASLFAFISQDLYEEDSVTHFLMAKYSFRHKWLLVNIWARPVPTLFHSLPAQFGIYFSKILQIIISAVTGIVSFYLGKRLGIKDNAALLILILFQPFFFLTSYNILTEPFFALVLSLSLFLLYSGNVKLSLITMSFLPLTRPEGYLLFPFFLICVIARKRFKNIHFILLIIGSFVWWASGSLIHSDFLWFIHNFPWGGERCYYGRGNIFDYVSVIPLITSFIGTPFLIYGIFACFNKKEWLLPLSFIIIVSFYSFIWWQGLLRSMLCLRYFAALAPLIGILMSKGLERLSKLAKILTIILFMIVSLFIVHLHFPFRLHPDHETIVQVFEWTKTNVRPSEKVLCSYFYFYYISDRDPFDYEKHPFPNKENISKLPPGSVIIWDNNFMIKEVEEDYLIDLHFKEMAEFRNNRGLIVKVFGLPYSH